MYDVGCHSRDDKVTDSVDGHRGKGCQEDCDASQCHMKVFVVHCKKSSKTMFTKYQPGFIKFRKKSESSEKFQNYLNVSK